MDKATAVVMALVVGVVGLALGLAIGFIGGLGLIGGGAAAILGGDPAEYSEYFEVEVLDYEVRDKGVYLKLENTGAGTVDDLYFEVEVRDDSGRLIEEYEINLMQVIGPGEVEETIQRPMTMAGEMPDMTGKTISVSYTYGWTSGEAY